MTRRVISGITDSRAVAGVCLALVAQVLLALPAQAAQTLAVDFETGPPVNTTPVTTQYLESAFVQFIEEDTGYRPYRRLVGSTKARSGTHVADVGADVCLMEAEVPEFCEFPGGGTSGRLSRTASTVTLYAGLFESLSPHPVSARLTGLRADGTVAAVGSPVVINATSFRTAVTVSSAAGDIASFVLSTEGQGSVGGTALGFDDLTIGFPDNSLPDVTLLWGAGTLEILQSRTVDVPVTALRINGSDGPLALSVTGLPTGVTVESITPNPLSGTDEDAVVRLKANGSAPPTTAQVTLHADPSGNANVAPVVRTVTRGLRVSSNFEITADPGGEASLGECAPVEYPLRVTRAETFKDVITLVADNVPAGISASFLPDDTLGPEGPFVYLPRLVLRRTSDDVPENASLIVRATAPGVNQRSITVPLDPVAPYAHIAGNAIGWGPMREKPGDRVTLEGNGFCPGSFVFVGATKTFADPADVVLAPDGRTLSFRVPRTAEDGPVLVARPDDGGFVRYETDNTLDVRTFRNYLGFQFDNFGWGLLSWRELEMLVGKDDLYLDVNPCWPIGDCTITTWIKDPTAVQIWLTMQPIIARSSGHCFGMVRTIQELTRGRLRYDKFQTGVTHPFSLNFPSAPTPALERYLSSRHAAQLTPEFWAKFLDRDQNLSHQVAQIRQELAARRWPALALMQFDRFKGHVVIPYDVVEVADGFDIYVYDDSEPYVPDETTGVEENHGEKEIGHLGVVRVRGGTWTFDRGEDKNWSGGRKTFWMIPFSAVAENPSLPTLKTVWQLPFLLGQVSSDGDVRLGEIQQPAQWLPVMDDAALTTANGTMLAPRGSEVPLEVTGTREGSYVAHFAGAGFGASLARVPTAPGVADTWNFLPQQDRLTLTSHSGRPLEVTLQTLAAGGATRTAVVRSTSSGAGRDTWRLDGAGVSLQHRGGATEVTMELSTTGPGGVVRASTPRLQLGTGDRVTVIPGDWRTLRRARVVVDDGDGGSSVRQVRLRVAGVDGSVKVLAPRLKQRPGRDVLRQALKLSGVDEQAVAGLVLTLRNRSGVVARKAVALTDLDASKVVTKWRIPARVRPGVYRLVARVSVVTGGADAGRRTLERVSTVRIS